MAQSTPPSVQVLFALDVSGSVTEDDFNFERAALADALQTIPTNCSVEIGVVVFGDTPAPTYARVLVSPTQVCNNTTAQGIANTVATFSRQGSVGTPLAAAIDLARQQLLNSPNFRAQRKQVINIVTDGAPNIPDGDNDPNNDGTLRFSQVACDAASNAANQAISDGIDMVSLEAIGRIVRDQSPEDQQDLTCLKSIARPQPARTLLVTDVCPTETITTGFLWLIDGVATGQNNRFRCALDQKIRILLPPPPPPPPPSDLDDFLELALQALQDENNAEALADLGQASKILKNFLRKKQRTLRIEKDLIKRLNSIEGILTREAASDEILESVRASRLLVQNLGLAFNGLDHQANEVLLAVNEARSLLAQGRSENLIEDKIIDAIDLKHEMIEGLFPELEGLIQALDEQLGALRGLIDAAIELDDLSSVIGTKVLLKLESAENIVEQIRLDVEALKEKLENGAGQVPAAPSGPRAQKLAHHCEPSPPSPLPFERERGAEGGVRALSTRCLLFQSVQTSQRLEYFAARADMTILGLEIFDLNGRLLAHRESSGLFRSIPKLSPGIYLAVLTMRREEGTLQRVLQKVLLK